MRYRKLDANGDFTFGHSQADFYVDQPEAVAQAVETRLALWTGQWFLDITEGTDWQSGVLGKYTSNLYDSIIKDRIVSTPGVDSIDSYSSTLDPSSRTLSVIAVINTAFGAATVQATL